jgi:predicted nucleic acid-binding protein
VLLIDTSVWIEVFKKDSRVKLEAVAPIDEIALCPPVFQEVLQGFRDEQAFRIAREALSAFPMVESPLPLEVFEAAAQLYRRARRSGLTVRSSVDCLIATCAIRHTLTVLHNDRDFPLLAQISGLQERTLSKSSREEG